MTDWHQIVHEQGPLVFRLARRITGRNEDAEDVVQDVFLEAFEYQQRETIRDWRGLLLHKTTLRSLDRIRRRRPDKPLDETTAVCSGDGPFQAAIVNELAATLRNAIAELPHQQAETFCLRYFEGLSNAEIAVSLETSVGAVATALHKARQTLSALFLNDF